MRRVEPFLRVAPIGESCEAIRGASPERADATRVGDGDQVAAALEPAHLELAVHALVVQRGERGRELEPVGLVERERLVEVDGAGFG